ncbi:thymidine kinase [Mariniluteicoccus endophyticus]
MADLVFFTGPMDCGKSTLALQMEHTQRLGGRRGELFTCRDRSGEAVITSRLGLQERATEVAPGFDFWKHVVHELTQGGHIDYLICDESQFYAPEQVDQLARIVDELDLDVFAFGILSDFRTEMFPGSKRLVELADRIETLQVQPLCWCGQRGTHNARTINGKMVTEGSQVVVGDTTAADTPAEDVPEVAYEVLCRRHHRRKVSRMVARATLSPDPLPFGSPDQED